MLSFGESTRGQGSLICIEVVFPYEFVKLLITQLFVFILLLDKKEFLSTFKSGYFTI